MCNAYRTSQRLTLTITTLLFLFLFIGTAFAGPWDNWKDQKKLRWDGLALDFIHYYKDEGNPGNGHHDPLEEIYYGAPPADSRFASDYSCWMAAACNLLEYAFPGEYGVATYKEMLLGRGDHAVPAGFQTPWGAAHDPSSGTHFTFDDSGYICMALSNEVGMEHECKWTNVEFDGGVWAINPVTWCQTKIAADSPVGYMMWWGNEANRNYHAMTLWKVVPTPGNPSTGTLWVTDSDDAHHGLRQNVTYTWAANKWKLNDPKHDANCYVNWISALIDPVSTEESTWSRLKLLYR